MATIPRRTVSATLTIETDDGEVELVERAHVPVLADPDVTELAVLGRLMRSAAGRYRANFADLLEPVRVAVAGGELDDPNGPTYAERACIMWRHAALTLLDGYLNGQPLDFKGEPVPDIVQSGLEAAYAEQQRAAQQAPIEPRYVGPGDTQIIVMPQAIKTPGEVPIDAAAVRHADNGGGDAWFVHVGGVDWRGVGPDGDGNLHTLHALFEAGDMIVVDPATGRPS